jgi:hypothetical protein
LREGLRLPVGQQIDRAPRLQIDQDRAVAVAPAPGPVVHPQHPGRGGRLGGPAAEQPQERVAVGGDADVPRQARPRLAPERHPERRQHRLQADHRPATPRGRPGDLLGERPARAVGDAAEKTPQRQPHAYGPPAGRQVAQLPRVAAVHPVRRLAAGGAAAARRRRYRLDNDVPFLLNDALGAHPG